MAHTGMFVAPVAGSPPVGMSPTDGRLVLGGIFQVASQLVAGGGFTASGTVMQVTVNQAVWSLTDVTNASAVFFTPTDQTTITFNAAPATGGRIDLVVVKQNNVENGDADSRSNVTLVTGTASGSPTPPAVPTGASKYLQVLINAGATNMQAAQVTITNYMQTQYADPQLQAPTFSALNSTTGILSQLGIVTSDGTATNNGVYLWNGSIWLPAAGPAMYHFGYIKSSAFSWPATLTAQTFDASPNEGVLGGFSTSDQKTFTCVTPGVYQIATQFTSATGTATNLNLQLNKNGSSHRLANGASSTAGNVSLGLTDTIRFAAGDTFQVLVQSGSNISGVTGIQTYLSVDFLHG